MKSSLFRRRFDKVDHISVNTNPVMDMDGLRRALTQRTMISSIDLRFKKSFSSIKSRIGVLPSPTSGRMVD